MSCCSGWLPMMADNLQLMTPDCAFCRGQTVALDVIRGLHAIHARHIIHFDIKSPNGRSSSRNFWHCVTSAVLTHSLESFGVSFLCFLHCLQMMWRWSDDSVVLSVLLTENYNAKIADVGLAQSLLSKSYISEMSQMRWVWRVAMLACTVYYGTRHSREIKAIRKIQYGSNNTIMLTHLPRAAYSHMYCPP